MDARLGVILQPWAPRTPQLEGCLTTAAAATRKRMTLSAAFSKAHDLVTDRTHRQLAYPASSWTSLSSSAPEASPAQLAVESVVAKGERLENEVLVQSSLEDLLRNADSVAAQCRC